MNTAKKERFQAAKTNESLVKAVPINNVIRPVMQLRAGLDRVSSIVLRKKMGFGVSQFRILYVLAFKPEISQKDIADFWDVTEASVSRQVSILEKQGLVSRSSKTMISSKGKKALTKALKYLNATFEKIFVGIPDADRRTVARLMENLIEKVRMQTLMLK